MDPTVQVVCVKTVSVLRSEMLSLIYTAHMSMTEMRLSITKSDLTLAHKILVLLRNSQSWLRLSESWAGPAGLNRVDSTRQG